MTGNGAMPDQEPTAPAPDRTTPSDPQTAAREQAIRAMARVIWAHLDTGDNERDKEIARQRATVLVAEMESAGLVIVGRGAAYRGWRSLAGKPVSKDERLRARDELFAALNEGGA